MLASQPAADSSSDDERSQHDDPEGDVDDEMRGAIDDAADAEDAMQPTDALLALATAGMERAQSPQ